MKYSYLSCLFLLFAAQTISAQEIDIDAYRTISGAHNNLENTDWGAAHTALLRLTGNGFADSISAPAGPDRPNPRAISNILFAQDGIINDPMQLSDYTWVFGQFIDHDIGLTENNNESINIPVPTGDPNFDPLGFGTVVIPMSRNTFMEGTGLSPDNPRQYPNEITAFIDGSAVYGSDDERAEWLRSFEGGKLKVSSGNLLPYNTIDGEFDSEVDPDAPFMGDDVGFATRLFVAGDVRANENPLLLALHTLFVLEHNRQCDLLAAENPDWDDQELYLHARKITAGILQSIVYNEWLPAMGVNLSPYEGYDPTVHPQLSNVFTAAAFRVGHTLLNSNIRRVDATGQILPAGNLTLRQAFFNVGAIAEVGGIEPYLRGMGEQNQQRFDAQVVDDVRNFLFGPPGAGGLDLASININRGRERGLPSFNRIRLEYGLTPYTFLEQINPNVETYAPLFQAYFGDIRRVDPWVGMLAEEPMPGALFGETILRIMEVQFAALRDGDRFFYLNDPLLTEEEVNMINSTTFRDIIMYNTDITLMQDNVFLTTAFDAVCENMTLDVTGGVLVQGTWDPLYDTQVNQFIGEENVSNIITNNLGIYNFPELSACESNVLVPERSDSWINGLTVQDIVIIQRHILGLAPLTSPYQYLAADANFNQDISVTDIVAIRRLILDLDQQFDNGQPWRFVLAGWSFSDPDHPWADDFPTTLNLAETPAANHNQGFVAYKLGDVDASANLSIGGGFAPDTEDNARSANPLLAVHYQDRLLEAGESFRLNLELEAAETLEGFQLAIDLGQGLQTEGSLNYSGEAELFHSLNADNELRLLVSQLNNGDFKLELPLRATRSMRLSEMLALVPDFQQLAISPTATGNVSLVALPDLDGPVVADQNAEVVAFPNPFVQEFQLNFKRPTAADGQLSIYNAAGQMVFNTQLAAASNNFRVVTGDWPAGEYIYRYESKLEQFEGSLIK